MMTVHEVSKLAGVSIRTLQYYDKMRGLGKMYSGGGDFTTNIDSYGGEGTAIFVANAIEVYCDNAE